MMQSKSLPRYAALIAGVLVASSCDTRLPTQVSGADDVERPVVTFSAAGAVNNAVSLAAPVVVTVKVSDGAQSSTQSVLYQATNAAPELPLAFRVTEGVVQVSVGGALALASG